MNYHCENKIADFTNAEFNELEIKLITLQRFVGINQLIGDPEMDMLIKFFSEHLKDFSLNEIEYSIHLAVAGILDVKIDHWQAFTAQYLYPIFQKYRTHRHYVLTKYYNAEEKILEQEKQAAKPEMTPEEKFLSEKELVSGAFENFKLKIAIIGMHRVFDILWDMRLIPYKSERMNEFEKVAAVELKTLAKERGGRDKSIYEDYLFSLGSKIDLSSPEDFKKHPAGFERKLIGHNAIVHKTKEVAVRNIFSYMVENDADVETYFKTLDISQNEKSM